MQRQHETRHSPTAETLNFNLLISKCTSNKSSKKIHQRIPEIKRIQLPKITIKHIWGRYDFDLVIRHGK